MNRKSSDEIRINLTVRDKDYFENHFLQVVEPLHVIFAFLHFENSFILYKVIVKDEKFLDDIKNTPGNAVAVYQNILTIIWHFECSKRCKHIFNLVHKYF